METVFIAGWREGIRDPDQQRHWRLYRGLSMDLIAAERVRFQLDGVELPMRTESSKQENEQGFHVWFDCVGDFTIYDDTCFVDLGAANGRMFSFSVRPKSLYSADDWRNWRVYDAQSGMNVRYVRFQYRGMPMAISTQARKITDPRELLAWIEVKGDLAVSADSGEVTVSIAKAKEWVKQPRIS